MADRQPLEKVSARIPEELHMLLKWKAKLTGKSISQLIRETLLEHYTKDSTTQVVWDNPLDNAKTVPQLLGRNIESMVTSIAPQGGKPISFRVDRETHKEFVKWARERGLDTCYLLTGCELSLMQREPNAMGGNIYVINLYSTYSVEKPRRIMEKKTVFERESDYVVDKPRRINYTEEIEMERIKMTRKRKPAGVIRL